MRFEGYGGMLIARRGFIMLGTINHGYPESVTEALANIYGDVAEMRASLAEGAIDLTPLASR